ncbi:MAG: ABC transporter permease [Deltaproteobacteria bacterium]|nr:ABC transporter permease [Deltaproteobacteria bacterium]
MNYITKRLLSTIPVLLLTSMAVFLVIHVIPGDPAELLAGPGVPDEEIQLMRETMGLERSLPEQYVRWLSNLVRGDFGESLVYGGPIMPLVMERFANTFILTLAGILFSVVLGIPLGIAAAIKQNTALDVFVMGLSIVGISMPIFWSGLLLIFFFSLELELFPATGIGGLSHLVLPAVAIGANSMAIIARMTRSSMLEVLRQDYILAAEARGVPDMVIIGKHAFKNALIPIVTIIAIQFGYLLGGAVVTETVFVYPGLGRLLVDAISRRDYPVVQACILLIALLFIVINIIVDIVYTYVDPKIRYEK